MFVFWRIADDLQPRSRRRAPAREPATAIGGPRHRLLPALLICLLSGATTAPSSSAGGHTQANQPTGIAMPAVVRGSAAPKTLALLYGSSPTRWLRRGRLTSAGHIALALLRRAPAHGLSSKRYALPQLQQRAALLPRDAQRFDHQLSAALLAYCLDLDRGSTELDASWRATGAQAVRGGERLNAIQRGLAEAIERGELARYVNSLLPKEPGYQSLQLALRRYRTIAATGGWQQIPPGPSLAIDSSGPRVAALRARLLRTSDLPIERGGGNLFDAALAGAVERFQRRHGLAADGRVGEQTLAALNRSVADKIVQIELNMDRWRALPTALPADLVMVNVPGYDLRLRLNGRQALDMRVIVGKPESPTPLMAQHLEQIVFHPYWYPPARLTAREIYPRLKTDPGYLAREGFQVLQAQGPAELLPVQAASRVSRLAATWDGRGALPFRLRQKPGPRNALGRVKFLLPNRQAIYLHDTPHKALFERARRAYSHGCIRLEEPARFAAALLARDQAWDKRRVAQAFADPARKAVELHRPVAVFLVYFTVVSEGTEVRFFPDVYGRDKTAPATKPRHQMARLAQDLALDHRG
ncbi:MAG: L,D-transpeptidase family protein [Pseudomonadota bacterium]